MTDKCEHGHWSKPYRQEPVKGGGTKWFGSTSTDELVFKRYISIFCPDCDERIEDTYESRPCKL